METKKGNLINNAFYNELDEKWHEASDHPIALLRAENALRNPWISAHLAQHFDGPVAVLDVGCGGGFLTNYLAELGHHVSGVDLSEKSLEVAREKDQSKNVDYKVASAYELPFEAATFDAVCAMDLLEHVEDPACVVKEASRVLKPGGIFFFHTFNRNLLSYFVVIKGVEWCFRNTPRNMHVYPLFITPKEMEQMCENHGLKSEAIVGVRPDVSQPSFWKLVFTRRMKSDFRFVFTPSLKTGYSGFAIKD